MLSHSSLQFFLFFLFKQKIVGNILNPSREMKKLWTTYKSTRLKDEQDTYQTNWQVLNEIEDNSVLHMKKHLTFVGY
jgi:hypothetical protein